MAKKKGTNLFKLLETDPELEDGGAWRTYPGHDSRFKIRCLSGSYVTQRRQELLEERGDALRAGGDARVAAVAEVSDLLLSDAIVADWEGVLDDAENELPYSVENSRMILSRLRRLADWIQGQSVEIAPYRVREDKTGSGNS